MSMMPSFDVVIPTVGRASLRRVLAAVVHGHGPRPSRVIVVDDRPAGAAPLDVPRRAPIPVTVLRSYGSGPAGARNVGWTAGDAAWVAFVDDDVEPPYDWRDQLVADLVAVHDDPTVAGSQARIVVPRVDRRPTDRERDVARLEVGRWITADLAYRRRALEAVGGFDERFRRAYREDSDLGLQVVAGVGEIARGCREVVHPVSLAPWNVSVGRQRGNAEDALMRARYGRGWRGRAGAYPTRLPQHLATTASALAAAGALLAGRRKAALMCAAAWSALTLELVAARAWTGSRRPAEVSALAATSAAIPPVAVWHRVRGELRVLVEAHGGLAPEQRVGPRTPRRAVVFDRDGTLVDDVPYNGDPDQVRLVDGADRAIADVRAAGLRVAVVTNQSGVARGLLTADDVRAVHRRIEDAVGPIDHWLVCPHAPGDGCRCRKPAPGLVLAAAARLGVRPMQCVVIGDTAADVAAARAVGARGILVPNAATRAEEIEQAPETAPSLPAAVARVLESV